MIDNWKDKITIQNERMNKYLMKMTDKQLILIRNLSKQNNAIKKEVSKSRLSHILIYKLNIWR